MNSGKLQAENISLHGLCSFIFKLIDLTHITVIY